ncbi:hypothetical protein Tco_0429033 [Tanacetum coccineum]
MLVRDKIREKGSTIVQLKLKLESEEDSTMALELIKFVKKLLAEVLNSPCFMVKSWLVHDQTVHALASPKANELTIPEQTATGKGTSNPFMAAKKQKVDDDKETAELKSLMEVMLDEEEVTLDVIPLVVVPPSIVDWKIHKEGKKSYYQILRADGSSQLT